MPVHWMRAWPGVPPAVLSSQRWAEVPGQAPAERMKSMASKFEPTVSMITSRAAGRVSWNTTSGEPAMVPPQE